MGRKELIAAMSLPSSHPDEKRDKSDLGRFGWGLKSASLSQARILTVVSWKKDSIYAARWNIDDLDDWSMDIFEGEEASKLLDTTPEKSSGTEIIWTNSGHLFDSKSNASIDERLNEKITYAKKHLSLVFHRYLVSEDSRKLEIFMQGAQLSLIDPFMRSHPATQTVEEEVI